MASKVMVILTPSTLVRNSTKAGLVAA